MNKHLSLARPDILTLKPYEHAVWQPQLERMHANENPWRAAGDNSIVGLNRYPECPPVALTERLANLYGVHPKQLLVGRGSDEGIDLLVRAFCRAGQDSVMICPPTFGYYKVAAKVQGADVIEVPLLNDRGFVLDHDGVLAAWRDNVKILFLCSPGNPTASLLDIAAIESLCRQLDGHSLVVVDEAYIEFAGRQSCIRLLPKYSNLVVLRTLSKAYALAGARCGAVIADHEIIELLERVIPPYAIPTATIESVLTVTDPAQQATIQERISLLIAERDKLSARLAKAPLIRKVYASDANFLLVDCIDADRIFAAAQSVNLVVRDQRSQFGLGTCLRISVGTPEQNERLISGISATAGAAA